MLNAKGGREEVGGGCQLAPSIFISPLHHFQKLPFLSSFIIFILVSWFLTNFFCQSSFLWDTNLTPSIFISLLHQIQKLPYSCYMWYHFEHDIDPFSFVNFRPSQKCRFSQGLTLISNWFVNIIWYLLISTSPPE